MKEIAKAEEKEAALAKQQKRGQGEQKESSQTISEVDDNYDDLVS